jgi:hypothetical protein
LRRAMKSRFGFQSCTKFTSCTHRDRGCAGVAGDFIHPERSCGGGVTRPVSLSAVRLYRCLHSEPAKVALISLATKCNAPAAIDGAFHPAGREFAKSCW